MFANKKKKKKQFSMKFLTELTELRINKRREVCSSIEGKLCAIFSFCRNLIKLEYIDEPLSCPLYFTYFP